jgi:hypothetical protein
MNLLLDVPVIGIAGSSPHLLFGNRELVALAGSDHETAFAAVADLTSDRIVEEPVLETIDNEPFKPVEGFSDLPAGPSQRRRGDRRISHYAAVLSCL